jgi:hypothetical protein
MHESFCDITQNKVNILKCDIEVIKNLNLSKLSINKNKGINPNKEKDLRSLF